MPCSNLAWWALGVGTEHLDAALRLLTQQVVVGGPILPSANFTVLRAGLVAASQAVVLLAPKRRDERTTAGLQIAREEYRQAHNFRKHTLEHAALSPAMRAKANEKDHLTHMTGRQRDVEALLAERGAAKSLRDTDMVEQAAGLLHTTANDAALLKLSVEMEWRLGSGAAHGRMLVGMHRRDGFQVEEGNVALFGGTYESVAEQIVSVSLMLNEAWRKWDLRRV